VFAGPRPLGAGGRALPDVMPWRNEPLDPETRVRAEAIFDAFDAEFPAFPGPITAGIEAIGFDAVREIGPVRLLTVEGLARDQSL